MRRQIVLKDGRPVLIRPIEMKDFEASQGFFSSLDASERRYMRRDVTKAEVVQTRINEARTYAVERLIALHEDEIVADGSLEHERFGWGDRIAQIRLIIHPDFRRVGLGSSMARLLYVIAHQQNVARLNVRILRPQKLCCEIFHRLGFREAFVLPDHVRDLEGNLQDLIILRSDLEMLWDGSDMEKTTQES